MPTQTKVTTASNSLRAKFLATTRKDKVLSMQMYTALIAMLSVVRYPSEYDATDKADAEELAQQAILKYQKMHGK